MPRSVSKTAATARALWTIGVVTTLFFPIMSATTATPSTAAQGGRVAVGDQAIDFTLESIDGESFRLGDLRGDSNAVIIFFRGTW